MAREVSHVINCQILKPIADKKKKKRIKIKKENVRLMKDPSVKIVCYSEINIYGYWNKNLV